MFGIGFGEMVIIAVILLIAVGPKQLPSLMKTVGKGMRDMKRASEELRKSSGIDALLRDEDLRNPMRPEPERHRLTAQDFAREAPREGVDGAHAQELAEQAARVPAPQGPSSQPYGQRPLASPAPVAQPFTGRPGSATPPAHQTLMGQPPPPEPVLAEVASRGAESGDATLEAHAAPREQKSESEPG